MHPERRLKSPVGCRILLVLAVLLVGSGGGKITQAQVPEPVEDPVGEPRFPSLTSSETDTSSSHYTSSLHFGRVLMGSTVGAGVGTGVGLLLVKGALEARPDDENDRREEDPAAEAAETVALIGAAAIVAGGPVGAVEIGGITRRRDAYVAAGFGEFMVGIVGFVLADRLHASTSSRLIGLGTGVAVGAAGGAYLGASQSESEGLFSYRDGRWQVATPEMRVRPHLTTDRPPTVGVSLVSVQW